MPEFLLFLVIGLLAAALCGWSRRNRGEVPKEPPTLPDDEPTLNVQNRKGDR